MYFFYALIKRKKINWAYFVRSHMLQCRRDDKGLVYPLAIMRILKKYRIDFEHEQRVYKIFSWPIGTHTFREGKKDDKGSSSTQPPPTSPPIIQECMDNIEQVRLHQFSLYTTMTRNYEEQMKALQK
ncbi:hypothetical protein HN51_058310 [Arachis hypogaea]|nr:uncharacterized protein DS421_20g687910 [Arachis hypogaea]